MVRLRIIHLAVFIRGLVLAGCNDSFEANFFLLSMKSEIIVIICFLVKDSIFDTFFQVFLYLPLDAEAVINVDSMHIRQKLFIILVLH